MSLYHQQYNMYIKSVTLNVKDLNKSRQFYTSVLGLRIVNETQSRLELGANKDEVLLTLNEVKTATSGHREGLYHLAFLFPSKVALANTFIHMVEQHYPFAGAADHGVSEALYLQDPDGNGIELYYDRDVKDWPVKDGHLDMYTKMINLDALIKTATIKFDTVDPATIIGHVHLKTNSISEMFEFYVDLIGFQMMVVYGKEAIFIADAKYHHHLGINTWEKPLDAHDPNQVGLQEMNLIIPSLKAMHFIEKLKKNDIKIFNDGSGDFIIDPIGIKLRLNYVN